LPYAVLLLWYLCNGEIVSIGRTRAKDSRCAPLHVRVAASVFLDDKIKPIRRWPPTIRRRQAMARQERRGSREFTQTGPAIPRGVTGEARGARRKAGFFWSNNLHNGAWQKQK
jgi:hypothetical protein